MVMSSNICLPLSYIISLGNSQYGLNILARVLALRNTGHIFSTSFFIAHVGKKAKLDFLQLSASNAL
jgi:hypothetical protein